MTLSKEARELIERTTADLAEFYNGIYARAEKMAEAEKARG